jgi:hypothetical protein
VSPPVIIDPNPLFQSQGHPERMFPVIDIDPLTDGLLERTGEGGHRNPIKMIDRSPIYKKRTLKKWSEVELTFIHERISDS